MKILAIDSTGLVSAVALVNETKIIAELSTNFKKTHSETLMPMIESIKAMTELDLSEIDFIACASGPGSFTGLRIGAATVKGLARGLDKKIIPVPTLDALAYNIFESSKIIVPMMDARRNQVYSCMYKWEGGKLKKLSDYLAEDIAVIIEMTNQYAEGTIFLGDGVLVHKEYISNHAENASFVPPHLNTQLASSVGCLALEYADTAIDAKDFSPFYLRVSQAERELREKK